MKRPLNKSQTNVLRWLRLYPCVQINWVGHENDRPMLMPQWMDDAAREHMIKTMGQLGMETDVNVSHPSGGTPSLTFRVFMSLLATGLIEKVGSRAPRLHWTPMYYYQISEAGRAALLPVAQPSAGPNA